MFPEVYNEMLDFFLWGAMESVGKLLCSPGLTVALFQFGWWRTL